MSSTQREKVLLGEAGEHLVLSRLMRHGHVASQAPRAWKAEDILIEGGARVQVKTTTKGTKHGWVVTDVKDHARLFYAMVDFGSESAGTVYVVPSAVVREASELADQQYRQKHPTSRDSGLRKFQDPCPYLVTDPYHKGWLQDYREAWHLIPTDDGQA